MLESDRIQYDREIESAQRDVENYERRLQDAIQSGVSSNGLDSYRRDLEKFRLNLRQAIHNKNTDYYGRSD